MRIIPKGTRFKMRLIVSGLVLLLPVGVCLMLSGILGQNPPQTRPPAFAPPLLSPEVATDRRVTFRLRAPNARNVLVARDGAPPAPLQRDEHGTWSLTTEPLAPDIYPYTFVVDDVVHLDPNNPNIKSVYRISLGQSLVHVPGSPSLSWEVNDVPHGTVTHHFYKSGVIGDERDFYVYTPPNYDPKRTEPYPVLFLLHGYTDDASAWTTVGRANVILDNLIAQGKARPMLMVNTLGYGAPEIIIGGFSGPGIRNPVVVQRNTSNFVSALLQEVIPQVQKRYNARKDGAGRAIAGLSMGGAQALYAGLNQPDKFAFVGGFSSAIMLLNPDYEKAFPTLDARINSQLRVLWVACGTEDFLIEPNRKFADWLKSKEIRFTRIEVPGAHTWMFWRRNLTDFAPLLFQANGR